jgi:hypothetical protein
MPLRNGEHGDGLDALATASLTGLGMWDGSKNLALY